MILSRCLSVSLSVCLLVAALAVPPARAQEAVVPDPFTQVLSRADLLAAGVFRLGDVFALLDGWQTASTEGFAADVSAGGLGPLGAEVVVLVDGQPIDVALFGTGNLHALPLHASAIERIEAVTVPTVAGGVFAPAGVLRIVTRRPAAGAALRGGVGLGNETGDPGPFRYTAAATPNIDRLGPNAWAAAGGAWRGLFAEASVHADEHHATDARIADRVRLLYDEPFNPRLIQTAPSVRLGSDGRAGRHRLFAGYSRLEDLRYLAPLGRELPLILNTIHVGASGDTAPGRSEGFAYRVGFTRLDTDPRSNRLGLDPDWREDRLRVHLTARTGTRRLGATLGAGFDQTALVTVQPVAPRGRLLGRVDAGVHGAAGRFVGMLGGAGVVGSERIGVKVLATTAVDVREAGTITLHTTYARRLPEEQRDFTSWQANGYRLPGAGTVPAAPYTLVGDVATADLAWAFQPATSVSFTARGRYRAFMRQTLAVYSFTPDSLGVGFVPAGQVTPDAAGQVVALEGEGAWRPARGLSLGAYYGYTRPFSDDAAFWSRWRPLAWHTASATARFTPNDRLALWARAQWTSGAYWPAYAGVGAAQLPAQLAVDVAVSKRFWGEHVHALLALRNALGADLRTHPAGAVTQLSLYVALRARFATGG